MEGEHARLPGSPSEGRLPIRIRFNPTIYGYYKCVDLDCLVGLGMESGFGDDWLKLGGVKIFVDAQGPDEQGRVLEWNRLSQKKLDDLVNKSHKAGLRVMMHTMTRAGHKAALDALEAALEEMPRKDHRHRIEHFDRDWQPERERLKKLEILAIPRRTARWAGTEMHGWTRLAPGKKSSRIEHTWMKV